MLDIEQVLNIPKSQIEKFHKKNIFTLEDVLYIMPRKYYDFRFPSIPNPFLNGSEIGIEGILKEITFDQSKKPSQLKGKIYHTQSNSTITVMWFGGYYLKDIYRQWVGQNVYCCGKLDFNPKYGYSIVSPLYFTNDVENGKRIYPVYPKYTGISDEYMEKLRCAAFEFCDLKDYLTDNQRESFYSAILPRRTQLNIMSFANNIVTSNIKELENIELRLVTLRTALRTAHNPKKLEDIIMAKFRLLFDDLFYLASGLEKQTRELSIGSPFGIKSLKKTYNFINSFPYKLTEDQQTVLENFIKQLRAGKRLNALVQGDVGCGKTIVAFISMFMMADSDYQSVLLAPTQTLAKQHYMELSFYAEKFGYKTAYLSGSLKAKEKKEILKGIKSGEYHFIVGTHSVFSKDVEYYNLGMVITDEEHKFGVNQREALESKASAGVHTISMSATPIPRSLAQTLYGGLKEVYSINSMPNGRKPVKTQVFNNDAGNFKFMKSEIQKGHQIYVVCKYVDESDASNVISTKEAYHALSDYFTSSGINIGLVSGKTPVVEAEKTIQEFKDNKVQILVATTIVEVGVNVPNASVIMIYDADMYGLSQLHQLRGRVGRGKEQGYCILKTSIDKATNNHKAVPDRLSFFCSTNNGFEIAEKDLEFRGTGDLMGIKQSGYNRYVEKMLTNPIFYKIIKSNISEMVDFGISDIAIIRMDNIHR